MITQQSNIIIIIIIIITVEPRFSILRLTVRPINRHHLPYNFFHKFLNTLQSEFESADGNIYVSNLPPNGTSHKWNSVT